jgi:hypothetical protein
MSEKKKVCICDNCGEEKECEENYHSKPESWHLGYPFEGGAMHACSYHCAIALTKKSIAALEEKAKEEVADDE